MRNYIAVVFSSSSEAYAGLHALWVMDDYGDVTVHGTAVAHRDERGNFSVDTKETYPALATSAGVGVGALLGVFAAGAADQASVEAAFVLGNGQSGVIADVSEDSFAWIDDRMRQLGGTVYRRSASDVEDDAWFDDYYVPYGYLYPYEYVPVYDAWWD